jgi:hypothetical protein
VKGEWNGVSGCADTINLIQGIGLEAAIHRGEGTPILRVGSTCGPSIAADEETLTVKRQRQDTPNDVD